MTKEECRGEGGWNYNEDEKHRQEAAEEGDGMSEGVMRDVLNSERQMRERTGNKKRDERN